MWIDRSWMKNIHPVSKILSSILMVATILLIDKAFYLLIVHVLFYFLVEEHPLLRKCIMLSLVFNVFAVFLPIWLGLNKLILLIAYFGFILKDSTLEKGMYLIEQILPVNSNMAITLTNGLYLLRLIKTNYLQLEQIQKSYGLEKNLPLQIKMLKQAKKQAKLEMNEVKILQKLRFYGAYPRRTKIKQYPFEVWDRNYLMSHLLFLILSIIMGR